MAFDFCDSAKRHFSDGDLLENERRSPNADHVYGLSAECALKAVMVAFGAQTDADGDLVDRSHWKHIDLLWAEYESFLTGRNASRYLAPLQNGPEDPFSDWRIDQRYAHRSTVAAPKQLAAHKKAAEACLVVLERAITDGKVTWIR